MSLFKKELWTLRWRWLILNVILILAGYFILAGYETFTSMVDINLLEDAFKQNQLLSKYLQTDLLNQIINNIDFYVWSQWFGKNFYQLMVISSIILAFPLFARETEQDTHNFLLVGYTRQTVFAAKVAAVLFSLLITVTIGCFMPLIMASAYDFSFGINQFIQYGLHMLTAVFFLCSIVIFFSIVSNDVIKPVIFSLIALFILAIPGFIGRPALSIYRYMTGTDIFFTGKVQTLAQVFILGLALVVTYISWYVYSRKEF